ncbi:MAG: 16S rRNA (guanine(527)-N(7))-methyltransferase RsmG [Rhodospirillaceae bacterium]|jgi:16S rRNA (guanine527-N7)-methyltransferase|nr:16S rRNA (guanine(527)-N(7))-methyltransferase RsmG [Rhodospirillaceae bacterium]MBT3494960.1 16S rRNA (guanine(527)-N(7))-methyltransferase RsmG [Rhodospirillaceae bacterium]MBT3780616.1 16S rRNA (guanine(527)-N(7))-methyltransferase RsmG [Rhodospirillaceae bacterium]MBT3975746.1 16S rRNA (guanine(527)-N(7))-methyltransferase RsmG [Rhodospirillaceae bacterium]MBT4168558.1 16S rRNA (guanine(527)-N(7))-methyltransferase RsmG [Rhodospirillaceae bacterium]
MCGETGDPLLPKDNETPSALTPAQFQKAADVSRETLDRLQAYEALLRKWNPRINLVSRRSLDDLWRRHMLDSIQLRTFYQDQDNKNLSDPWLDLGSGAGFPGLVLAIAGVQNIHLIESDGRKCAFLREAARVTGTEVTVHNERIETLPPQAARTISARALGPLPRLLSLAYPHLVAGGQILLLKGQDVDAELTEATKYWKIKVRRIPSVTDGSGSILQLTEISRV